MNKKTVEATIEEFNNFVQANEAIGMPVEEKFYNRMMDALNALQVLAPKKDNTNKKAAQKEHVVKKVVYAMNLNHKQTTEKKFNGVSEHAMVRILERKAGFDVEALRKEVADTISPKYKTMGDGKYHIYNGDMTLVVKGGMVVTVL